MSRFSLSTLRHGVRQDVARHGRLRLLANHLSAENDSRETDNANAKDNNNSLSLLLS